MGVDEENLQVMAEEIIMENSPKHIPAVHTYKYR